MRNCKVTIEDNELVVRIDLTQSVGMSASGKNLNIGTTAGNKKVAKLADGRDVILGVNCYTSPEAGQ